MPDIIKFVPISYYSYNIPEYYACIIALSMYFIVFVILFIILKYEWLNKNNLCDPMYYYGKSCRNTISQNILLDPDFLKKKRDFYNNRDNINKTLGTDVEQIQDINQNVDNKMEEIRNLNKHLGNIKDLFSNTLANFQSVTNVKEMPSYLIDFKNNVQTIASEMATPAMAPYAVPLTKLYNSLKETVDTHSKSPSTPPIFG